MIIGMKVSTSLSINIHLSVHPRNIIYRGSFMSAYVLLILLNEFGEKRKNARLPKHFITSLHEFHKFINE